MRTLFSETILPALMVAALLFGNQSVNAADNDFNVWLSGVDPVVLHDRDRNATDNDFMELFKSASSWAKASARVQVFKVSTQFLHRSSDEQLTTVVQYLRSHHIALALEAEIMVTSVRCGNGNPGFTTTNVIHKAAERVRSVGGQIDYVMFDEPMAFGRAHRRPGQCGFSIEQLVRNIEPNIRTFKQAFPGVVFGDIEPVSDATLTSPGYLDNMLEFARVFHEQTGEKLASLQADIIWQNRWQPQLVDWRNRLHAAGMKFGVIFDGDPGDRSDSEWAAHAISRYRLVVSNPKMLPDDVVFQSWQKLPSHFLPDDAPGTLTNIVLKSLEN
jgi:hypothetical protein